MAQFHFVEDYVRHVAKLIEAHPLDQAMSLAVGGHYEEAGTGLAELVIGLGLGDGHAVLDLGCGSGRVATKLARRVNISYTGFDVVAALLDYAATKCPNHYRFIHHCDLSVPVSDKSIDFAIAFSFFTHLLHEESYIYMQDTYRALRPGGRLVLSYLELAKPSHWVQFEATVKRCRQQGDGPLCMFMERDALTAMARHAGFEIVTLEASAGGQSVAVFARPR